MSALVRYDEMRIAVAQCARIDEAAEIRDKAMALAAYARQRDDRDLEVWVREIQLRACTRIGELVQELDTAQGQREPLPDGRKKLDAISDAGLSRSTAYEYQELAGGRSEQARATGKAAMEHYFAKRRQEREPPTMEGLRGAIKESLTATFGAAPERKRKPITEPTPESEEPLGTDWIDWTAAVKHLSESDADLAYLAAKMPPPHPMHHDLLAEARAALSRLNEWVHRLESIDVAA